MISFVYSFNILRSTSRARFSSSSSNTLQGENTSENSNPISRANSIVGTMAFMAPEILILYGQRKLHEDGYTRAVDFWRLGIMIYKLLTGMQALNSFSYQTFQTVFPVHLSNFDNYKDAFEAFFGDINYEICNGLLNDQSKSLLQGLLQFHADNRLGYNPTDMKSGFDALMNHPFFGTINWDLVETKQFPPPYIPNLETLAIVREESTNSKTLCELLIDSGKSRWCEEFAGLDNPVSKGKSSMTIHANNQFYFRNWYYAQPIIN